MVVLMEGGLCCCCCGCGCGVAVALLLLPPFSILRPTLSLLLSIAPDDDDVVAVDVVVAAPVVDELPAISSTQGLTLLTPLKFTAALSLPLVGTIPIVCILLLVTSSGYASVCANSPDSAPHCNRSIVVGSLPITVVMRRLACSLMVNATPE